MRVQCVEKRAAAFSFGRAMLSLRLRFTLRCKGTFVLTKTYLDGCMSISRINYTH